MLNKIHDLLVQMNTTLEVLLAAEALESQTKVYEIWRSGKGLTSVLVGKVRADSFKEAVMSLNPQPEEMPDGSYELNGFKITPTEPADTFRGILKDDAAPKQLEFKHLLELERFLINNPGDHAVRVYYTHSFPTTIKVRYSGDTNTVEYFGRGRRIGWYVFRGDRSITKLVVENPCPPPDTTETSDQVTPVSRRPFKSDEFFDFVRKNPGIYSVKAINTDQGKHTFLLYQFNPKVSDLVWVSNLGRWVVAKGFNASTRIYILSVCSNTRG